MTSSLHKYQEIQNLDEKSTTTAQGEVPTCTKPPDTPTRSTSPPLPSPGKLIENQARYSLSPNKKKCLDQDDKPSTLNAKEDSKKLGSTNGSVLLNIETTRLGSEKEASPGFSIVQSDSLKDPTRSNHVSLHRSTSVDRLTTSESNVRESRHQTASPKNGSPPSRKRSRDQDADAIGDENSVNIEPSNGRGKLDDRTSRLEPEKKRIRDNSMDQFDLSQDSTRSSHASLCGLTSDDRLKIQDSNGQVTKIKPDSPKRKSSSEKLQTSASAFSNSGFASLASSTISPFGSLATARPSLFRSSEAEGNATSGNSSSTAKSSFLTASRNTCFPGTLSGHNSHGFGSGDGTTSGFGAIANGSIFGSKLGTGFASSSGPKLSSFAGPSTESYLMTTKPAKAFGAPENEEEGSEADSTYGGGGIEDEDNDQVGLDEKKKIKLPKVHIDDGEAGEVTLLQIRAKLFALESKEVGWKERGVGMLKINIPESSASYDENGLPIPGSYHPSEQIAEEKDIKTPRVARLIMRQENTHRVVLNTIILREMQFEDKVAFSSSQLVFTAFEGDKELRPIKMLLKMSEANAKLFKSEIESIQREL